MSTYFSCPTIDFIFLQDLSGSFTDDLPVLQSQIPSIIAAVEDIDQNADFAVASFVDKPTGAFGAPGDYVYQTNLPLTADNDAVIATMNSLTTLSGADAEEAQLEALLQVSVRPDELGLRADSMKVVMLSTDAAFHQAGDFVGAPANNGDAVLDGGGVGEDYPSIAQTADALVAAGIFPIFAVTADQVATYENLVTDLGTGAVVTISSNSADFADAVTLALAKACGHVTQEGTELDDSLDGTEFEDGIFGLGGDDILNGFGGTDLLDGGSGMDDLRGGAGGDELRGGTGDDTLSGGAGIDFLSGGLGNDRLIGGADNDIFVINPGEGADTIVDFQDGGDVIDLSAFHRFEGKAAVANAVQFGGAVVMTLPNGATVTIEGMTLAQLGLDDGMLNLVGDAPVAVADAAVATASQPLLIDVLANDSDVDGDALTITSVSTSLNATAIITASGQIGYVANDGFSGTDTFTYTISDGTFTDTATVTMTVLPNLIGDNTANLLNGTEFADLIRGKGGDDTLNGFGDSDRITGDAGNDLIDGGEGRDKIKGGDGNDTINGGPSFDTGGQDKDDINGGRGNDQITGGFGDDRINAGSGGDTVSGDQGDDKIVGGGGRDLLDGGIDNDEIHGGGANDQIIGGLGNDQIWGDKGADTISGGDGNDQIYGSGGPGAGGGKDDDVLTGGLGADSFIFDMLLGQDISGDDIITDYDIALDHIELNGDVLVSLTDTVGGVLIEQVSGASILVENVLAADIRPTIFGLVEI